MPLGALATFRRLALFVAAGIEPRAAIPLCGSPWRQPRNPARHISPKALVLGAECLLERRFFNHHHPDMKKKPEQRAVPEETPVTKQKGLTKNDRDDRDVDRISHVAIKASHYELLWRRDRGGRPQPLQRKTGK